MAHEVQSPSARDRLHHALVARLPGPLADEVDALPAFVDTLDRLASDRWTPEALSRWASTQHWSGVEARGVVYRLSKLPIYGPCLEHAGQIAATCSSCRADAIAVAS